MFILLSGRMGSGKTILSNELLNQGYEKVSFASYLRELVSSIYEIDLSLLKTEQGKQEVLKEPLIWNQKYLLKLSNLIGEDFNFEAENKSFLNRRSALQYIGTEVLKKHDANFHAKKLISQLDFNKNYVCDDLRFPDELEIASNFDSKSFHIIRPCRRNVSNHISETSLNWTYFDNIIVNDTTEEEMKNKFNYLFSNSFNEDRSYEEDISFLIPTKKYAYFAGLFSKAKFVDNSLEISFKNKIIIENKLSCILAAGGKLKIKNNRVLENLKLWYPENKSFPDLIKNNSSLISSWNKGVKDADNLLI